MKYVAAVIAIGVSLLLAFWLALNVLAVVSIRGIGAVPREIFATWPQNLIFGIVATVAVALFAAGIAVLANRERTS